MSIIAALVAALLCAVPAVGSAGDRPASAFRSASFVRLDTPADTPPAPAGTRTTIARGLRGFDSVNVETQAQIDCLSAADYSYDMIDTNDTSNAEYSRAAAAGMAVVLFQGYYQPYWLDAKFGTSQGNKAVAAAVTVKYPHGAQIYLNLENAGNSTRTILLSWVKNWAAAVRAGSYVAGVYVGANPVLTASDLDAMPGVSAYWRSASTSGVPQVTRGYAQRQSSADFEKALCGTTIDGDTADTDRTAVGLVGAAFPAPLALPTAAGAFAPLAPNRILDTRLSAGAPGPVGARKSIDVQVAGRGGVPSTGAAAAVLNVTVTGPTAAGFLSAFPTATGNASVSSLNFTPNQTVANLVTVRLGAGGKVSLYNGSQGGVQVLADIAGYYLNGTAAQPGTFTPVTPARLLDTRPGGVAPGSRTTVTTAGRAQLPSSGYDTVVLNLTAVEPQAPGYLTAYAANLTRPPNASNLNFPARRTVPNMTTVPVDSAGQLLAYNGSAGHTDLLADVAGYYRSGSRTDRGAFTPVSPARILDTRSNVGSAGMVPASSGIALKIAGQPSVLLGSTAVVLNVTVVDQRAPGYLSVYPSDRTPQASSINFVPGLDVANQVVVPIGADGRIVLLNSSAGATDLIVDVAGYFTG